MRMCAGYSRLRPDLPKVVEELRQVSLEQPLKLQAQRHDPLQEHTCTSSAHAWKYMYRHNTEYFWSWHLAFVVTLKKNLWVYRGRGGDGVQSEEVADVHFPEYAVQLGWLVVQETQRCNCGINMRIHKSTYTHTHTVISCSCSVPPASLVWELTGAKIYSPYIENPWKGITPVKIRFWSVSAVNTHKHLYIYASIFI